LRGRDPRDAAMISSRACGVCGGVHSVTSVMAQEMAYGVTPPPLAVVMRNLAGAAEMMYDHPLHLFLLAGPDYSAAIVSKTNPTLYETAKKTPAEHRDIHGFSTIGDLMEALNPLSGKLYLEAIQITRIAREMFSLMLGRYPHPSTLVPGGVSTTLRPDLFTDYLVRLTKIYDWAKTVALIWEDLVNFFYKEVPEYENVGKASKINIICGGIYDDPELAESGDLYKYDKAKEWGERRMVTPGVIKDGQLETTSLIDANVGLEEFVTHSYYEEWEKQPKILEKDPLGNPLSVDHPWNKITIPKPGPLNWREKYTWDTAPRWNKLVVETGGGPLARHWLTAIANKIPSNPFIKAGGGRLKITVPKGATLPEMELEWKVPKVINALERNRARAYHIPYVIGVAMNFLLKAFEYLRAGKTKVWNKFEIPREGIGVGFYEAGRGWLSHHLIIKDYKIYNYQIITPSTINASPRDPLDQPGPYEEAALNTPIVEKFTTPEQFTGIDILRSIRSFDPCMPCTVHMFTGGRVITRDVTTCACSI
ncbi:cytochrome C, partial [Sulfolobus sp. E3]